MTPAAMATLAGPESVDGRSRYYQELKSRIHSELLNRIDLDRLTRLQREIAEPELRNLIAGMLDRESAATPLSLFERESLMTDVMNELFGLGPLEALLRDGSISDILVNRHDQVYVERDGKLEETDIMFKDDGHLMQIIERIVSSVGRRIDESSPMVDARLADGSRVNAIIPPLALDGPTMSIRRFRTDRLGAHDLVERNSWTEPMLEFLQAAVACRLNLIVSGGTGSGKTTLLNLVPRLFDVTEGAVLVDGVDVRDIDLQTLWTRIGLVPQRPFLFSGTVESNLRHGNPDATEADLWEALEIAQARDFVSAMPGGLSATIEQGGTNVSGGQRQRLAIARALLRKPDIYLFDDSFSALDLATDARLRAALMPYTKDAAVVVVAQRVNTIRRADQILVLEHGVPVGLGTHHELLASCPTYAEIVSSQMTEEEAA